MAEAVDYRVTNSIIDILNDNETYSADNPDEIQAAQATLDTIISLIGTTSDPRVHNLQESQALIAQVRDNFTRFNSTWDAYVLTLTLPTDEVEKNAALGEALDYVIENPFIPSPIAPLLPKIPQAYWNSIVAAFQNPNPQEGQAELDALIAFIPGDVNNLKEENKESVRQCLEFIKLNFETYNQAFDEYVAEHRLSLDTKDNPENLAALRKAAIWVLVTTGGEVTEAPRQITLPTRYQQGAITTLKGSIPEVRKSAFASLISTARREFESPQKEEVITILQLLQAKSDQYRAEFNQNLALTEVNGNEALAFQMVLDKIFIPSGVESPLLSNVSSIISIRQKAQELSTQFHNNPSQYRSLQTELIKYIAEQRALVIKNHPQLLMSFNAEAAALTEFGIQRKWGTYRLAQTDAYVVLGSSTLSVIVGAIESKDTNLNEEATEEATPQDEVSTGSAIPIALKNILPRFTYPTFHGFKNLTPFEKAMLSRNYNASGVLFLIGQNIPEGESHSDQPLAALDTNYAEAAGYVLPEEGWEFVSADTLGNTMEAWAIAGVQKRRVSVSRTDWTGNGLVTFASDTALDMVLNFHSSNRLHNVNVQIKASNTVYFPSKEEVDDYRADLEAAAENDQELQEWLDKQSDSDLANLLEQAGSVSSSNSHATYLAFCDDYGEEYAELCDGTEGDKTFVNAIVQGAEGEHYKEPFPSVDQVAELFEQSGWLSATTNGALAMFSHVSRLDLKPEAKISLMVALGGGQLVMNQGFNLINGDDFDLKRAGLEAGLMVLAGTENELSNGDEVILTRVASGNEMIFSAWNRSLANYGLAPHVEDPLTFLKLLVNPIFPNDAEPQHGGGVFPSAYYYTNLGVNNTNMLLTGKDGGRSIYRVQKATDPKEKAAHIMVPVLGGAAVVIGAARTAYTFRTDTPNIPYYSEEEIAKLQKTFKDTPFTVIGPEVGAGLLWGIGMIWGYLAEKNDDKKLADPSLATLQEIKPFKVGYDGAIAGGEIHYGRNGDGVIDWRLKGVMGENALTRTMPMPTHPFSTFGDGQQQLGLVLTGAFGTQGRSYPTNP